MEWILQSEIQYEIKNGHYWEESAFVFKEYVEPLKQAKTQQDVWKDQKDVKYNAALREIIKLYLNSLSGKVGQREYVKDIEFCFTENQIRTFLNKHKDVIYTDIPKMNCVKLEGLNEKYKYKKENLIYSHHSHYNIWDKIKNHA